MKVAWLTPLARRTGISRYSLSVVRALSSLGDVEVVVHHDLTDDDFACPWAETRPIGPGTVLDLALSDAVFFNLGNHHAYHAAIYDCYRKVPGVVVLHDKVMQDFFFNYAYHVRENPALYRCLMGYLYGAEATRYAIGGSPEGTMFPEEVRATYPMFEPCLWNATGVVTHSAGSREIVEQRYRELLPVADLEMPHFIYDMEYAGQPLFSRTELELPAEKVLLVSSGYFAPHKRLDVLIRALASDPQLRARALLVIAGGGHADYRAHLRATIEELDLTEQVRIVLEPDDHVLHSLIASSDVAINLRYPSTESGSASLVEQLHFGKPVIVSDVGVYAEFPDEVVLKVDVTDELASLTAALRTLVLDPEARAERARAAAEYARRHFSAERYAESLLAFADRAKLEGSLLRRVDAAAERELRGLPVSAMAAKAAPLARSLVADDTPPASGR